MIQVGRFEVDPARHTLNCGAERVKIGARAFDILMLLAASRGRLVTKDELIKHVKTTCRFISRLCARCLAKTGI
jgi:DNA-binding winged helix-turn-helix (wHTH) protein